MSTTMTSSLASYHFHLPYRHRSCAPMVSPFCLPRTSTALVNQGLSLLYIKPGGRARRTIKMDLNAVNNIEPGAPVPSGSPFPGWSNWLLLTVIPMILPFFKSKWGPLIFIKKQVDTALETVESVAEAVEDVAVKIDKVADEMVEKLPEGSKLKSAIKLVDSVAEEVIKDADITEELIEKVEEVEKKVEDFLEKEMDQPKVEPKSS